MPKIVTSFTEAGQLFLQGGGAFFRFRKLTGDFTELGFVAYRGYKELAKAACDIGTGVQHVDAFGHRRFPV